MLSQRARKSSTQKRVVRGKLQPWWLEFSGVRDLDSGAVMKLAAVGNFTTCADGRKVKGMIQGV